VRVAFVVFNIYGAGGTVRSVTTQANALVRAGVDVSIISMVRDADRPHYQVDDAVVLAPLVDRRVKDRPRSVRGVVDDDVAVRLDAIPSVLVPYRWDWQFSALIDAACEEALSGLEADVLVTVTPGLLVLAAQLVSGRTALVHQEHRSSSQRQSGMEPLLTFGPRADVVAMLTDSVRDWFVGTLGAVAPKTIVVPNALPTGYRPRSTLDTRLIVAAGRLVGEKQFPRLVQAFGAITDQIPDWRLRILGDGQLRAELLRLIRKLNLYDRVELPGRSADMPSEWAAASMSALTSRIEGLPLVVQEAMAAGVPVTAYDAPSGARALIRHEVNGLLVSPQSIDGLAASMLRLATDDDLRTRLGQGAFESSRSYAADLIAQRWIEVFEAAANGRSAGAGRVLRQLSGLPEVSRTHTSTPEAATDTTPSQARALALEWATRCAQRASSRWFVIPPHAGRTTTVVVPMDDRNAFLSELGSQGAPELLSLVDTAGQGWLERRDRIPDLARVLADARTGRMSLEPWPDRGGLPGLLSTGCRTDLEFWETAPDGTLVAPDANPYTKQVDSDTPTVPIEVEGIRVRTIPLMAEATVLDCRFPIDAVYTWVDGSDPAWNAAREARLAELPASAHRKEASGRARFVSRDELRYSMRSLHLFAPWLRTIHVVTAGQVPPWLTEDPRVRIVDHSEILPSEALPTFHSHAIESSLHKVPDLAEQFVYFNDDVLLGRPVPPQIFFTPSGQPAVFFSPYSIGLEDPTRGTPWLQAAWNNRRLLRETFGFVSTHSLAHVPHPHRRSVLDEIEGRFTEELARTARSPFRSADDLSLLSSFAQHYGVATGAAVIGSGVNAYVDIGTFDVRRRLRRVLQRDQDFVCLGDHHEHSLKPEVLQEVLHGFFETYLPVTAPWER